MSTLLYTDGSALNNNGDKHKISPGGIGYVVLFNGLELRGSLGYFNTTNNRMEFLAIILPLEELQVPTKIRVYTDSQIVIDSMTKWIKKWERKGWINVKGRPLTNLDLILRLRDLMKFHQVSYSWVKGHSGDYYNEICNDLAYEAACSPSEVDSGYMLR